MTMVEMLDAADELDLSGDSAVERVTAEFTITEAEHEETESDNGSGRRAVLTFESDNWPYPITMRLFTSYTPVDSSKSVEWVKRQRGQLKNIVKAATGSTNATGFADPSSDNYLVGKRVQATTKDGGDGFAVLGRFKKASE